MAKLFHTTCYQSRWWKFRRWLRGMEGVPRFVSLVDRFQSERLTCTQTFRCEGCGDTIHVDTDWFDAAGGFIGRSVEEPLYKPTPRSEP